jgi:Domain of unknown function (DUF1707)
MAAAAVAAGHGHLRASHADREQVLDVLKAAFVQGRLTRDELDARVGHAFVSRTLADLAALTADLPAGLIRARPPGKPHQAQHPHPENKFVNSCACLTVAIFALTGALLTGNSGVFFVVAIAVFGVLLALGGGMIYSSHKNHSRRRR